MKHFTTGTSLIALALIFCCSCKKVNTLQKSTNFDVVNRVFRVNETPNGQTVKITITEIKPNFATNPYSNLQVNVNSNFNYGFTPDIGDSVKVLVQSSASVSGYVGYQGVNFPPTIINPSVNGAIDVEYDYLVKN